MWQKQPQKGLVTVNRGGRVFKTFTMAYNEIPEQDTSRFPFGALLFLIGFVLGGIIACITTLIILKN
jgi:hypothetical protein